MELQALDFEDAPPLPSGGGGGGGGIGRTKSATPAPVSTSGRPAAGASDAADGTAPTASA